ncbi:XRE family transcriptional regulator [Micromonospora sp. NPDC050686]|uniref:helix-turn-helix domain-containing protein n=1 Tax=Micromonospora sp. NPDC050686 TaxID=3154631 RepID=UPI0033D26B95
MAGKPGNLADRLNQLFATVRRPDRREYSNEEVASAILQRQGVTVSASYLWYLRTGQRDNPTVRHLNALAAFFGVPTAYFVDDEAARRVDAELAVATAMRDVGVRTVALRANGLSAESLETIRDVIDRVRQLEGLPPTGDGAAGG